MRHASLLVLITVLISTLPARSAEAENQGERWVVVATEGLNYCALPRTHLTVSVPSTPGSSVGTYTITSWDLFSFIHCVSGKYVPSFPAGTYSLRSYVVIVRT